MELVPPSRSRRGQEGVALVVTLILLAVITTLAIAFLGLTNRETGAVDAMSRTTDAELAADAALARARAEILTPILFQNTLSNGTDILGPEMLVSVCCQNFDTEPTSPTFRHTISYDRQVADQRITNRYDAAPPVFVDTNRVGQIGPRGPLDDRFYVDLNRNGYFEESGFVPVRDNAGQLVFDTGGNLVTNFVRGDPQWIGLLQNPRRPHRANNRFIGRYAFMVLPAGRSLDINWIHNDAKSAGLYGPGLSGFIRNQGVAGFENNLAAFLCDLNANAWNNINPPYSAAPYDYFTDSLTANRGTAFDDAWQILNARYGGSKPTVDRMNALFFPTPLANVQAVVQNDLIDVFGNGDLQSAQVNTWPWPGADSRRHLFSVHDYFDTNTIPYLIPFTERMLNVSKQPSSYDRYTFYRMLAQLGTDSSEQIEEDEGKVNLNYINVRSWVTGDQLRATDLIPWNSPQVVNVPRLGGNVDLGRSGPELFFLSAVTNLLMREYPQHLYGLVNPAGLPFQPLRIPVYTNNSRFAWSNSVNFGLLYSGRIHQILQQAANIYDATRPLDGNEPMVPTVFRPQYTEIGGNVFIVNYVMVNGEEPFRVMAFNNDATRRWVDLDVGAKPGLDNGVFNIPLIIGARKGYPNFNEFRSRTIALAVRRLRAEKNLGQTNFSQFRFTETLSLSVTNEFSMEAWNSYRTPFPRPLAYYYTNEVTVGVSGRYRSNVIQSNNVFGASMLVNSSPLWRGGAFSNSPVATRLVHREDFVSPVDAGGTPDRVDVTVTNRIRFFLVDGDPTSPNGRIVDAISFSITNSFMDLGRELALTQPNASTLSLRELWSRDSISKPWDQGVEQQLLISQGIGTAGREWENFGDFVPNKDAGVIAFNGFITNLNLLSADVPFVAVRMIAQDNSWQVNDPLVHYTVDDLARSNSVPETIIPRRNLGAFSIGTVNSGRYAPWPSNPTFTSPGGPNADITLRDPSIRSSDNWDFPTNKFPNVGWLGRVHRGTPWQTIYLKSRNPNAAFWRQIAGPLRPQADLNAMLPTQDRRLFDVFTTTIHPNAARGRLSINQTNLASWSAALASIVTSAVTNDSSKDPSIGELPILSTNEVVHPVAASVNGEIETILTSISGNRLARPGRQFRRLGDILDVPALTEESPFVNNPSLIAANFNSLAPPDMMAVTDADYERIPQEILSLLKVGKPRFVVYGWGQSLKPARLGVQKDGADRILFDQPLSGPSIDPGSKIVNNYQVTGEVATRAVVKVVFPEVFPTNDPNDPDFNQIDYSKPRLVVESFNIIPIE